MRECNVSQSTLFNVEFSDLVSWHGTSIDSKTSLKSVVFTAVYDVINDASETIRYSSFLDFLSSWKRVHFLSKFPVFGISWLAFVLSVLLVNSVALLNSHRFVQTLEYPIPIPENIGLIILSSLLLGVSSGIYKSVCPEILQNFTEAQWVYEHRHPRIKYLIASLSAKCWRRSCMLLLLLGGFIAIYILGQRLMGAVVYIFNF
jgi:hypothetical protein